MAKRIWIPKELYELVQQEAEREGKKPRDLISEIVEKHIKEVKRK